MNNINNENKPLEDKNANTPPKNGKSRSKAGQFMDKQGFYIVLLLCIAIVGVSVFLAVNSPGNPDSPDNGQSVQQDQHGGLESQIADLRATPSPSPTASLSPETTDNLDNSNKAQATVSLGLPVNGEIVKVFSNDQLLYSETLNQWMTHGGIDIRAEEGTDVSAALAGTVVSAKMDELMGYTVVLEHSNSMKTVYAAMLESSAVKEGDQVAKGQIIGKVGNTAKAELAQGAHLHFEFTIDDKAQNPEKYLETIIKASPSSEK
ncbi:MAG: peptidoglycan DD-metalloendopeptidase family protein [Christensenellales bacterium]|jgi:murein DD-endopeptidase MepM/ murein hydrolase activator NlpD